jgi:hypothetical protein
MLAAFKCPPWNFFVPSTVGALTAIVVAFDEERKGFDLHAVWARA